MFYPSLLVKKKIPTLELRAWQVWQDFQYASYEQNAASSIIWHVQLWNLMIWQYIICHVYLGGGHYLWEGVGACIGGGVSWNHTKTPGCLLWDCHDVTWEEGSWNQLLVDDHEITLGKCHRIQFLGGVPPDTPFWQYIYSYTHFLKCMREIWIGGRAAQCWGRGLWDYTYLEGEDHEFTDNIFTSNRCLPLQ